MTVAEQLTLRVLSTLLREDVLGLRTSGRPERRPDGPWVRLEAGGRRLALPVAPEGFQCEYAARLPLLEADGERLTSLPGVLTVFEALAAPEDRSGYRDFAAECHQTLATMELHAASGPEVLAGLAARYGADPADWTGPEGSLAFDALAAFLDHPVYPAARGRLGLQSGQLRRYAPEFHRAFELRWVGVPEPGLTVRGAGTLPPWWPTPARLGLPDGMLMVPVHPLTFRHVTRLAVPCDRPWLTVRPTLSMRTVAVATDPTCHLKLPLATSSLGLRNRRTIKPGSLADGAAGQRLLAAVIERQPRFAGRVLLADEQCYAHADHELLAVLLRRYPPGPPGAATVPLAALLATAPSGRLVIDHLAERFYAGSPLALYDALLTLVLDWHTTLFRYGIALESHQQNTSLVLDRKAGRTRLRLLFKDNDGLRVNTARLGGLTRFADEFDDARIRCADDRPLTDLYTTITVHLCTAALAFGLAAHDRVPLAVTLGLLRTRLAEAAARAGEPGAVLRAAVLDADRLPVKAMVTAGTLLDKERSGAADINKHYTSGPNYLKELG